MPQQSGTVEMGGERRQGLDYVVPNIRLTLFTNHTVVDDIDGAQTEIHEGDHYSYREGRPALIVSSTSWCISNLAYFRVLDVCHARILQFGALRDALYSEL